jgi:hypothetical protein
VKIKDGIQQLVINVLNVAMKTKKVTSHLNANGMAIETGLKKEVRFEILGV